MEDMCYKDMTGITQNCGYLWGNGGSHIGEHTWGFYRAGKCLFCGLGGVTLCLHREHEFEFSTRPVLQVLGSHTLDSHGADQTTTQARRQSDFSRCSHWRPHTQKQSQSSQSSTTLMSRQHFISKREHTRMRFTHRSSLRGASTPSQMLRRKAWSPPAMPPVCAQVTKAQTVMFPSRTESEASDTEAGREQNAAEWREITLYQGLAGANRGILTQRPWPGAGHCSSGSVFSVVLAT